MKRQTCPTCQQLIPLAHKEIMDKTRLTMLRMAADYVIANNVGWFKKKDIGLETLGQAAYGNFTRLRYHGLITPLRDDAGNRIKGKWIITRNGWAFLRGEKDIHKYVLVKNNHISARSDVKINIRQVYYGSDTIQTTFEYYDDYGNMVGFAPKSRSNINPDQVRMAI